MLIRLAHGCKRMDVSFSQLTMLHIVPTVLNPACQTIGAVERVKASVTEHRSVACTFKPGAEIIHGADIHIERGMCGRARGGGHTGRLPYAAAARLMLPRDPNSKRCCVRGRPPNLPSPSILSPRPVPTYSPRKSGGIACSRIKFLSPA